jgi:hypothetical protein
MDDVIKNYNPLMQVDLVEGSPHWASYLINGDASGLDERDVELCDAWVERLADDGWEVSDIRRNDAGESDPEFSWRYGQVTGDDVSGGDIVEYVVHRWGPFVPPAGRVYDVVYHFDVWGHPPDECEQHGCPCMVERIEVDGDARNHVKEHDDDRCECTYSVNDSRRIGQLFVPEIDVFERDLVTLLRDHMEFSGASEDYDEESPGDFIEINEKDGKPVLTLFPVC